MASWSEVVIAAPELARSVQGRFDAHGLGLLATLRRDGSPRISGIEPLFALGELWLGMMPDSRKAHDLLRDPRFALHSATTDKQVTDGDAKVSGRAVPVDADDDATFTAMRGAFAAHTGSPPPPGPFHLFRGDVVELSTVRPAGDHLDIDSWHEGGQVKRVERF
ncbi:MAG: pyridoxamine 5'-phosphate oxidase family protein [Acidimicrobiia bacterium]